MSEVVDEEEGEPSEMGVRFVWVGWCNVIHCDPLAPRPSLASQPYTTGFMSSLVPPPPPRPLLHLSSLTLLHFNSLSWLHFASLPLHLPHNTDVTTLPQYNIITISSSPIAAKLPSLPLEVPGVRVSVSERERETECQAPSASRSTDTPAVVITPDGIAVGPPPSVEHHQED